MRLGMRDKRMRQVPRVVGEMGKRCDAGREDHMARRQRASIFQIKAEVLAIAREGMHGGLVTVESGLTLEPPGIVEEELERNWLLPRETKASEIAVNGVFARGVRDGDRTKG